MKAAKVRGLPAGLVSCASNLWPVAVSAAAAAICCVPDSNSWSGWGLSVRAALGGVAVVLRHASLCISIAVDLSLCLFRHASSSRGPVTYSQCCLMHGYKYNSSCAAWQAVHGRQQCQGGVVWVSLCCVVDFNAAVCGGGLQAAQDLKLFSEPQDGGVPPAACST